MAITPTQLLQLSRQYGRFYHRQFIPLLEETGLSMREVHVLLFLANNPEYDTARDVSEFRSLSKSQVSQAVDLLVAEGFLLRTPDLTDRRVIHLSLTEDALPLTKQAQALQAECGRQLLSGISAEQEKQLQLILEIMLKNGAKLGGEG